LYFSFFQALPVHLAIDSSLHLETVNKWLHWLEHTILTILLLFVFRETPTLWWFRNILLLRNYLMIQRQDRKLPDPEANHGFSMPLIWFLRADFDTCKIGYKSRIELRNSKPHYWRANNAWGIVLFQKKHVLIRI
jgi:hypothetical protein